MQASQGKLLGTILASGVVIAIAVSEGSFTGRVLVGALVLALPLALLWFPDELASIASSYGRGGTINTASPSGLVSGIGWLLLILIPVVFFLIP